MPKVYALLIALLTGLSGISHAQVYKSIDAEGNVVYSDTPTEDAEEVQVPKANVADSVEVPAVTPPEPKPEVKTEKTPQPEVTVITDDGDDDGDMSIREKRRKAKRRHERRK
jgi:hypothetical protein